LDIILADTSYSDFQAKDGRGAAVSEVLIEGTTLRADNILSVHGVLRNKEPVEFKIGKGGDPYIGLPAKDGWWVKAKLRDVPPDKKIYHLSKEEGYKIHENWVTEEEVAGLASSIDTISGI